MDRLKLVDVLQRLGLGYHFEEEIKDVLGSMPIERANLMFQDDIHSMSLLFRLLREHGFPVSQGNDSSHMEYLSFPR